MAKTELLIIRSCQKLNAQCEEIDISIASSASGPLKHVRPFISIDVAVQIYNALILPHFDYCSLVWVCISGHLCDKLQKLQNRPARCQQNINMANSIQNRTAPSQKLVFKNSHTVCHGSKNIFQIIIIGHGDKLSYITFSCSSQLPHFWPPKFATWQQPSGQFQTLVEG